MAWPEDFAAWAEKAYPVVYGKVYHRLRRRGVPPRKAAELAEEGRQFAFLQAAKEKDKPGFFQSYEHFVNWLVKVADRHALDQLRRKRLAALPPDLVQLETVLRQRRALSPAVWECLKKLPLQERRVLLLYYFHGLTDVDIGLCEFDPAEGTETALGQRARKIRLRALDLLRQCLLERGVDPDTWEIHPESEEGGS